MAAKWFPLNILVISDVSILLHFNCFFVGTSSCFYIFILNILAMYLYYYISIPSIYSAFSLGLVAAAQLLIYVRAINGCS